MRPPRIAPFALAALCACGTAARADSGHQLFQVRLQLLSSCRVAAAPVAFDADAAGQALLSIRCSRRTPFALGWGAATPPLTGTGAGLARISATWPLRDNRGENPAIALDAGAGHATLHVNY